MVVVAAQLPTPSTQVALGRAWLLHFAAPPCQPLTLNTATALGVLAEVWSWSGRSRALVNADGTVRCHCSS